MGKKILRSPHGQATDVDYDVDVNLEDIPDDTLDESELDAWLKSSAEKETKTEDQDETEVDTGYEDVYSGRIPDGDMPWHGWHEFDKEDMFTYKTVGRGDDKREVKIGFHPVRFPRYLYQRYAIHSRGNDPEDIYTLRHAFNDPRCDGFYRRGNHILNAVIREQAWETAPRSALVSLAGDLADYLALHPRALNPSRDAYVIGANPEKPDTLYINPETGALRFSPGYADPKDNLTTEYHLAVDWLDPETWNPMTADDETREAMALVDDFLAGPTGDEPLLEARLLQILAAMVSTNKRGAGLVVARGNDTAGDAESNGKNAKSTVFRLIGKLFPGRVVDSSLNGLTDNLGLGRLQNGALCWYSDDASSYMSDEMLEILRVLSTDGKQMVNIKYKALPETVQNVNFVLATNETSFNLAIRSNNFALLRRLVEMPFPTKMRPGCPHWVENIEDKLVNNPIAKSYLFYLMMCARSYFVSHEYKYIELPEQYGGMARDMLINSNPVERWLYDVGEEYIFGHHPSWGRIPHLFTFGAQKYLAYPLDAEPGAAAYHKRLVSNQTWTTGVKYYDTSSCTYKTGLPDGTKVCVANAKAFLYKHFESWCRDNGVKPVGSQEWAKKLEARTPTTSVEPAKGVPTPFGRVTVLLPIGETYKHFVSRCCEETAGTDPAATTAGTTERHTPDVDRLIHLVNVVVGKGQVHVEGDHASIDKWAALVLAQAALSAAGVINDTDKLGLIA